MRAGPVGGGVAWCVVAWALRLAKGAGQAQSPRRVHPKHPEIVKRVDRGGGESVLVVVREVALAAPAAGVG